MNRVAVAAVALACACKGSGKHAEPAEQAGALPAAHSAEVARLGKLGASVQARELVARADGGLVMTGQLFGDLELGGKLLHAAPREPVSFVVTLDRAGQVGWARAFDGQCLGLHVAERDGRVAVAGECTKPIELASGTSLAPPGEDGKVHVFLAELDAHGAIEWAKYEGGAGRQLVHAVAIDPAGNVVLAGGFTDSIDLGTGKVEAMDRAAFVASIDAAGNTRWLKTFPNAVAQAVAISGDAIAVAGSFSLSTTIGANQLEAAGVAGRAGGRFAARLGLDGAVRGAFVVAPGSGASSRQELAAAPNGRLVLAADTLYGMQLFALTETEARPLATISTRDPCLFEHAALAVDPQGGIVLGGCFSKSIDLGAGAIAADAHGNPDAFVARYTADGKLAGTHAFATEWSDYLGGVAVDAKGDVLAAPVSQKAPPGKRYQDVLSTEVFYTTTIARLSL